MQAIPSVAALLDNSWREADLDGDEDLDVLGKPYTWNPPSLNIRINEGPAHK